MKPPTRHDQAANVGEQWHVICFNGAQGCTLNANINDWNRVNRRVC